MSRDGHSAAEARLCRKGWIEDGPANNADERKRPSKVVSAWRVRSPPRKV